MNEKRDLNKIILDILNQSNKEKYISEILPRINELNENQTINLLLSLENEPIRNVEEIYFKLFTTNKYLMHADYNDKINHEVPMAIYNRVFDYYYNQFPNSNLALDFFKYEKNIDDALTFYVFNKTNNIELKNIIKKSNDYDIIRILQEDTFQSKELIYPSLIKDTINELQSNYLNKEELYDSQFNNYLQDFDKSKFSFVDSEIHKQKQESIYDLSFYLIDELNKGSIKLSNDELDSLTIDNSINLLIKTDNKYLEIFSKAKYTPSIVLDEIYRTYSNNRNEIDNNVVLYNLARNNNTNLRTLYNINNNEKAPIRCALIDNKNISRNILNSLNKEFPDYYYSMFLAKQPEKGNRKTISERANELLQKDFNDLKIEYYSKIELLKEYPSDIPFSNHKNSLVLRTNDKLSKEMFDLKDQTINLKLASNPNTSSDVLFALSKIKNIPILKALMDNPSVLNDGPILNSIVSNHPQLLLVKKAKYALENTVIDKEAIVDTIDNEDNNKLLNEIESNNWKISDLNKNIIDSLNKLKNKFYSYKYGYETLKDNILNLNSNTDNVKYDFFYKQNKDVLDQHEIKIVKTKSNYEIKYKDYESFTLVEDIVVDHNKSIFDINKFKTFVEANAYVNKELNSLSIDNEFKKLSANDIVDAFDFLDEYSKDEYSSTNKESNTFKHK